MAKLNVQYIINRKGGHNLTFDGYIYRVNHRREDKVFWRCVERGCQAFLSTFNDIPTGFGRQNHNHPAEHSNVVAKQIMSKISRRRAEEIRPIPKMFIEELTRLTDNEWDDTCREVVEKIPTFNSTNSMPSTEPAENRHPHFQRLRQIYS